MKKMHVLTDLVRVLIAGVAFLHASSGVGLAQLATSAWPMFQHDARHSGQSAAVGPAVAHVNWTYRSFQGFRSASAIGADGTIYVGNGRLLCAVKPSDGSEVWCTYTGGAVKFSSPAVLLDGTICVGGRDNR